MAFKSFLSSRRNDIYPRRVTGRKTEYFISDSAGKARDASITFKYYRYGAYMGTTTFYWEIGGVLNQLTVLSSNTNAYTTMTSQHHTNIGQTWLTGTIDLVDFEASSPGRFVIEHVASSDSSNFFTGDFQIDHVEINLTNGETINLDPDLKRTAALDNWQKSNLNPSSYAVATWANPATTEDSNSFWCYDSGGTGSTNTGDTVNSDGSGTDYYLYTEVSGAASNRGYLRTSSTYNLVG